MVLKVFMDHLVRYLPNTPGTISPSPKSDGISISFSVQGIPIATNEERPFNFFTKTLMLSDRVPHIDMDILGIAYLDQ